MQRLNASPRLAAATAALTALATFAAMAVFALVLALALGACAPAAEPYPVIAAAPATGLDALRKIAVVQAPDVDGAPGAWLACGVFTAVHRCAGCDGP